MHSIRSRFTTVCQQLLALAVVLTVLVPATGVISLDVVEPGADHARGAAQFAAYVAETEQASVLPAEDVEPVLEEHPLTPAGEEEPVAATERTTASGAVTVTSEPAEVTGYGAVGVTWDGGERLSEDEITLRARTRTDGEWSEWTELVYHDEHAPDPGSAEQASARPGTDELLVGEVDEVQVQATTPAGTTPPTDMRLAVVAPGEAEREEVARAEIDTAALKAATGAAPAVGDAPADAGPGQPSAEGPKQAAGPDGGQDADLSSDQISLQAAAYTPAPQIYSRQQWGADEKLRDKGSLKYHEVHAGFVHHTVNANNYTRAEVPGIIRSIYAYHTKSRGWSDLGYNFLVDRFGRIWEGRAGGVDRPVVGAHTQGYNEYSFAMSAIGNFETAKPTEAMLQAYGALFAWKLSLHGVAAGDTSQKVGKKTFQAINGHRDAGSTACPGKHLYAQIPRIRTLAAAGQRGWSGRELASNLAGSAHPDLVVRRTSDKRLFVLPTVAAGGAGSAGTKASFARSGASAGWGKYASVVVSPDLTGDGRADALVTNKRGTAAVRPGKANGTFGRAIRGTKLFRGMTQIGAVGDLNRDGRNDLIAASRKTTRLYVYLGRGNGTFRRVALAPGWTTRYDKIAAVGNLNGDRYPDVVGRTRAGVLYLHPGKARSRFGARVKIGSGWQGFDTIARAGDVDGDGRDDMFARRSNGTAYLYHGTGKGGFRAAVGPLAGTAGIAALSGGVRVLASRATDLVGRNGDRLVVFRHVAATAPAPATGVALGRPIDTGRTAPTARQLLNVGDWDRDGHGDVIVVTTAGTLELMLGDGAGRLGAPRRIGTGWSTVQLIAAVGDMTGDGYPDLMGQPKGGAMRIYPGRGVAGFGANYVAYSAVSGSRQVGVGLWDGDGAPDSLVRSGNRLRLYPGNGPGGLTGTKTLAGDLSRYDWVVGIPNPLLSGPPGVVVREKATGSLYLLPGAANGVGAPSLLGTGMGGYDRVG